MMIPPVLGPSVPAADVDPAGEGFAEAMAAAIGLVPTPSPLPTPVPSGPTGQAETTGESRVATLVPAPIPITGLSEQVARLAHSAAHPLPTGGPRTNEPVGDGAATMVDVGGSVAAVSSARQIVMTDEPVLAHPAVADRAESLFDAAGNEIRLAPVTVTSTQDSPTGEPLRNDIEVEAAITPVEGAPSSVETGTGSLAPTVTGDITESADTPIAFRPGTGEVGPTAEPGGPRPTREAGSTDTDDPSPRAEPEPPARSATEHSVDASFAGPSDPAPIGASDRTERSGFVPSSTLRRVEDAIRRLEHAPPPRTITIAVDEQGLHRVTVSLHSDGVRLSIPTGASTDVGLVAELERSLEHRGFDLSGRGQHGRQQQQQHDEAERFVPTAPRRPLTQTTDHVRI